METYTTKQIASIVAERTELPMELVHGIIEDFIEVTSALLDEGHDAKIKLLGTFAWKVRKPQRWYDFRVGKSIGLDNRLKLTWAPPVRFAKGRPMEKYGVVMDDKKTKQASEGGKPDSCPDCGKKTDSGGACPDHGTEPMEKKPNE